MRFLPTGGRVGLAVGLSALLFSGGGCVSTAETHENLHSTLWVQTSAEYFAITKQTYNAATGRLEEIALERDSSTLAVILDIDETVLDNSPYQARLVRDGAVFDSETWAGWVAERSARPIPGAPEFIARARQLGFNVLYITNRDAAGREHTLANMRAVADPEAQDRLILYSGENGWGSDKQPRRDVVAARAEIVMIIGDDLGDFTSPIEIDDELRRSIATNGPWGESWFMLPNPTYGKWERSLYNFERLGELEKLERKYGKLRTD
ncbi:MAG: HAD family acid phosphatase [Planctomycetota bacterium]